MSGSYRLLLGPIPFMGAAFYEVQDIDAAGNLLSGADTDPAAALAELEAELARHGRDPGDWRCSPAMAAALRLPPGRTGAPDPVQRTTLIAAAMFRHEAHALWPFASDAALEAVLGALARLAGRAPALPVGRSFPYRAAIEGSDRGLWHVALTRNDTGVSLAVTDDAPALRRLYDAAMGGAEDPAAVDLAAAVLAVPGDWLGGAMEAAFGTAFSPLLFARRDGTRRPLDDAAALRIGAIAAACAAGTGQGGPGAPGTGRVSAGPVTLHCAVDPFDP